MSFAHSEKEGLFPLLFAVVSSVPNPPFIPIYAAGVEEEAQEKKLGMRDGKIVLCSTFTTKKGGGRKQVVLRWWYLVQEQGGAVCKYANGPHNE